MKGSGGGGRTYVRQASHAGSWYSKDGATLAGQLEGWLEAARADGDRDAGEGPVRAVIAPHAGYRYQYRARGGWAVNRDGCRC